MQWLNNNKEPWDEVTFHWKRTSKARYEKLITKGKGTVDAYMRQFPLMTHSLGHVLINIDFHQLYEKKETDIYAEWPLFFECFYATACERNLNKAKDLVTLLTKDLSDRKYIFLCCYVRNVSMTLLFLKSIFRIIAFNKHIVFLWR